MPEGTIRWLGPDESREHDCAYEAIPYRLWADFEPEADATDTA